MLTNSYDEPGFNYLHEVIMNSEFQSQHPFFDRSLDTQSTKAYTAPVCNSTHCTGSPYPQDYQKEVTCRLPDYPAASQDFQTVNPRIGEEFAFRSPYSLESPKSSPETQAPPHILSQFSVVEPRSSTNGWSPINAYKLPNPSEEQPYRELCDCGSLIYHNFLATSCDNCSPSAKSYSTPSRPNCNNSIQPMYKAWEKDQSTYFPESLHKTLLHSNAHSSESLAVYSTQYLQNFDSQSTVQVTSPKDVSQEKSINVTNHWAAELHEHTPLIPCIDMATSAFKERSTSFERNAHIITKAVGSLPVTIDFPERGSPLLTEEHHGFLRQEVPCSKSSPCESTASYGDQMDTILERCADQYSYSETLPCSYRVVCAEELSSNGRIEESKDKSTGLGSDHNSTKTCDKLCPSFGFLSAFTRLLVPSSKVSYGDASSRSTSPSDKVTTTTESSFDWWSHNVNRYLNDALIARPSETTFTASIGYSTSNSTPDRGIDEHSNSTTNIDELKTFACKFKQRRMKLGVTQAEVGRALGCLQIGGFGCLSQSTICRFESLTLSHNNMLVLKPILEAWLDLMEEQQKQMKANNAISEEDANLSDFYSADVHFCGPDRRRRRTSITDPEKRLLEAYFRAQPKPSTEELALIANRIKLRKNVVRVWFCNQRQKQKRLQTKHKIYNIPNPISTD